MTALPLDIVRFDRELHGAYVRESWAKAARLDRRELDWWLRRHETRSVVATVPKAPHLILGWAVGVPDEGFLVWVQVKKLWWGRGVGKALAASALQSWVGDGIRYAYQSRLAELICRGLGGALKFDPTLARRVPRARDWSAERKDAAAERE